MLSFFRVPALLLLIFIFPGMDTNDPGKAKTINFRDSTFDIYFIDLKTDTLEFFLKDSNNVNLHSINNLKKFVEQSGRSLVFATNGGMYKKDGSPQGLYIENKETIATIDTGNAYGNFYLKPNGVFLLSESGAKIIKTEDYFSLNETVYFATQSGPLLLIKGELHEAFNENSKSKYIRSGVGIINEQNIVFVISNQPVNFYDFALFFKEILKCRNALYLDGAISKMYIKQTNRNELNGEFGCIIGHVMR